MINLGDFPSQQTVYLMTNAHKGDGTPIDGAGGLAVSVYKDDGTTEYASDITLTGTFDSRTGLISIKIVTTNAFYVAGHDYFIVVTTGTVDSISVVSYVLAAFSIENRSALMPTESGRKLDVSALGKVTVGTNDDKSGYALATAPPTVEEIREEMDDNSTQLAAIRAKTNSLPAIWCSP